jgi:hypothetical protein
MSGKPLSCRQSWTREDFVTSRTLRRSIGIEPLLLLAILKVALVLLISARIRPRALELF